MVNEACSYLRAANIHTNHKAILCRDFYHHALARVWLIGNRKQSLSQTELKIQSRRRLANSNFFCISSKDTPLVSGYTNKTTKNCATIISEKKTKG